MGSVQARQAHHLGPIATFHAAAFLTVEGMLRLGLEVSTGAKSTIKDVSCARQEAPGQSSAYRARHLGYRRGGMQVLHLAG